MATPRRLSASNLRVLAAVLDLRRQRLPCGVRRIATLLDEHPHVIWEHLDRLERAGLVKRERGPGTGNTVRPTCHFIPADQL